jgi:hypothetical protein
MRGTLLRRCWSIAVLVGGSVMLATACPDVTDDTMNAKCKTQITGSTSPAPGVLTLNGQFYSDETVLLQTVQSGQTVTVGSGTPASNRTAFTLINMPSGNRVYNLVISCAGGQDDRGSVTYLVQ